MAYSLGAVERAMKVQEVIVLRQNSVRRQVIDLAGLIQRKFRLDGPPPAPPAFDCFPSSAALTAMSPWRTWPYATSSPSTRGR